MDRRTDRQAQTNMPLQLLRRSWGNKNSSPSYIILRIQRLEANSVDLDEVAHHEPPHQDLHCLQIQLLSSLVLFSATFISGIIILYVGLCSFLTL